MFDRESVRKTQHWLGHHPIDMGTENKPQLSRIAPIKD